MKKAFFDPNTRLLKTFGYIEANEPDDLMLEVADSFNETVGRVKLNPTGDGVVPYTPPPPTAAEKDAEAQADLDRQKMLKAVVLWVADLHDLTPAQAKAAVLAKSRNL
jgi:hypothetical protein